MLRCRCRRGPSLRVPAIITFAGVLVALAAPGAQPQRVTLVAVGDICLARGVEHAMAKKGAGYPFDATRAVLRQADIAFGNLECCLSLGGKAVPKKYNFRGHPRNAGALREAGFDIVSLANNHTFDYGRPALADTMVSLNAAGVAHVGAGRTPAESRALKVVRAKGVRVGFLAYLGLFPSILPIESGKPAVAMAELSHIRRDVAAARPKVDYLVVSIHAGKEYTFRSTSRQQAMARAAVDAGADLVVGHHPHVVQEVETYREKPIYYSLGNFVFDPSPRFLKDRGRRWSGMAVVTFERGRRVRADLVDLRIVNRQPKVSGPAGLAVVQSHLGAIRDARANSPRNRAKTRPPS